MTQSLLEPLARHLSAAVTASLKNGRSFTAPQFPQGAVALMPTALYSFELPYPSVDLRLSTIEQYTLCTHG